MINSSEASMKKLIIFPIIFLFALAVGSCSDDDLQLPSDETESLLPDYKDEFSVNLSVTLDEMGGTVLGVNDPMYEIENYIDPEKFRILFFSADDKFLFESKSRRVKKLGKSGDFTEWLVSVPFYKSGNDTGEYDWRWDEIRDSLMADSFKIAILANRPLMECYPDLTSMYGTTGKNKFFDNSGPNWTKDDFLKKDIFDLHHTQYDPIYTDKGRRSATKNLEGYYDFVMGYDPKAKSGEERLLSSTSCWVDHGDDLQDSRKLTVTKATDGGSTTRRRFRMPTQDYPIPMYGVQKFAPITDWTRGTPFNLSDVSHGGNKNYDFRSVSMIRSVVRLDLYIPKKVGSYTVSKPSYVALRYSNIYARCEPIDTWTPTDITWKDSHTNCEWEYIMNYGGMARADGDNGLTGLKNNGEYESQWGSTAETESFKKYRPRISWLYGVWKEKNWHFKTLNPSHATADSVSVPLETATTRYPRIYNPCIQRNEIVMWDTKNEPGYDPLKDETDYYHFIVYTGERNANDPSDLFNIGNPNSGKPVIEYWMFNIKYNGKNTIYAVPITKTLTSGSNYFTYTGYNDGTEPGNMFGDGSVKFGGSSSTAVKTIAYEKNFMNAPTNRSIMPYVLMRNHCYRIFLGTKAASRAGEDPTLVPILTEDLATRDIRFK